MEKKYISINFLSNGGEENSIKEQIYLKPSLGNYINKTYSNKIVTFPMNYPKLENLNNEDTNWVLGENKDKKRREEKILLGETERLLYDGRSKHQINSNNLSE